MVVITKVLQMFLFSGYKKLQCRFRRYLNWRRYAVFPRWLLLVIGKRCTNYMVREVKWGGFPSTSKPSSCQFYILAYFLLKVLFVGSYDHQAKVWDTREEGNEPLVCIDHDAPIEAVVLLRGDAVLATAGGTTIKLWDIASGGRLLCTLQNHHKSVIHSLRIIKILYKRVSL